MDKESLLAINPVTLKPEFKQPTSAYVAVENEEKIMEADANKLVALLRKPTDKKLKNKFPVLP